MSLQIQIPCYMYIHIYVYVYTYHTCVPIFLFSFVSVYFKYTNTKSLYCYEVRHLNKEVTLESDIYEINNDKK